MHRLITLIAITTMATWMPGTNGDDAEDYVVRCHDVAFLLIGDASYPYSATLPASTHHRPKATANNIPPEPTMAGGGGFGGGFAPTGGGFFSVAPESDIYPSAFNGQGTVDVAVSQTSPPAHPVTLVTALVSPGSWAASGGQGRCSLVGKSLVVRQLPAVQEKIEAFLNQLTEAFAGQDTQLTLRAWWLPVSADERADLVKDLANATPQTLDQVCDDVKGVRAELRCQQSRIAHTAVGSRQSLVDSVLPVVGTGASGYSPMVEYVNLGYMIEAQPVEIQTTSDTSEHRHFHLNLRSALTFSDEDGVERRTKPWSTDNVKVGAHVVESPCRVQLNKAQVAGSFTLPRDCQWFGSTEQPVDLVHVVLLSSKAP